MTEPENLSLENICGGAVEEVFQRELTYVLGRMYGVSKQQIHRIVRGVKWRHVR